MEQAWRKSHPHQPRDLVALRRLGLVVVHLPTKILYGTGQPWVEISVAGGAAPFILDDPTEE